MAHDDVKKFYNETMPAKFGTDYEHNRWFRDDIQRAGYDLTLRAIGMHVLSNNLLSPVRMFELGPGAGTWTKHLRNRFPGAYIDLVDISKEMLARAQASLGVHDNLRYIESDILDWKPEGTYDFFFSSRVLEYIGDKKQFCKKIFDTLSADGRGFVITKMPHYTREKLLRRKTSALHGGQISPITLVALLRDAGFEDVVAYPVTVSIPLFHNASLNLHVGKILSNYPIGLLGMFFAESYAVVFRKPQKV